MPVRSSVNFQKILKRLTRFKILKILAIIVAMGYLTIGCQPASIANPPPTPAASVRTATVQIATAPESTSGTFTCRTQVKAFNGLPFLDVEFDFADGQFQHLPVVTKQIENSRTRANSEGETPIIWDALYSSDGNYDYWTTPVLRNYPFEKTAPLVISRGAGGGEHGDSTQRLNATLSVNLGGNAFPVTCAPRTAPEESSGSASTIAKVHACRAQIAPGSRPLLDVEFEYLTNIAVQNSDRYPYTQENLYVKATRPGQNASSSLEALFGSDGDYSYWTTPVLRDVGGGTNPMVIVEEPGFGNLNGRLSIDFAGETYPVTCSE